MTASDNEQLPQSANAGPEAGTPAPDSEALLRVNSHSTATALSNVLRQEKPRIWQQGLLEFPVESGETPVPNDVIPPLEQSAPVTEAGNPHQPAEGQPPDEEGSPPSYGGLFGVPVASGRRS